MKCRRNFTVIELLVVAAIIGILASILLPSLHRAREKAIVSLCISNQKQLMVAYNTYSLSNDDWAVRHRWYNDHSGTQGTHGWCDETVEERPLNEYIEGGYEISHCPAEKGDPRSNWSETRNSITFGSSWVVAYTGGTMSMFKHSTNIAADRDISIAGFEYPASKSVFHNVINRGDRLWNNENGRAKWHDEKNPRYTLPFVDGHVVYFNFWWKKTEKYDPGKGKNIDWLIENLGLY